MDNATAPNAKRLLWAGFFSIFAAGVGFSVRAGILPDWARAYGFTNTELGGITGGGLIGFGIVIILGSLIADRIGYGILMGLAFFMHFLSAVLVLFSDPVYQNLGKDWVYWSLFVSMFLFSIANGLCEVVVNPMTATLFPKQKTHYLNILHAGWPGGLIAGGLIALFMNEPKLGDWDPGWKVDWLIQMSLFLVPVLIYGGLLLGQRLPRSEAEEAGVSVTTMLLEFVSPILLLLLVIHALVGYVELGTDSWIGKITGAIMGEGALGRLLFVYTSALMFILRFFAGPLEQKLTPLGLLFACSVLASLGLVLVSTATGVLLCLMAVTVYGFGKTYFWPTMLAVVSERFPRGGAITLGAIGGVGMLSAGLLGGPGIGFNQDYYASSELKKEAQPTYNRYAAAEDNTFYGLVSTRGLDGSKVGVLDLDLKIQEKGKAIKEFQAELYTATDSAKKNELEAKIKKTEAAAADIKKELDKTLELAASSKDENTKKLPEWWAANKQFADVDKTPIKEADTYGGRMALLLTAIVPAVMAVLYLFLILYFKMQGGYKAVVLEDPRAKFAAAGAADRWQTTDEHIRDEQRRAGIREADDRVQ
jgi:MFS family permease